jgi:ribosomal RNA-processing protein 12
LVRAVSVTRKKKGSLIFGAEFNEPMTHKLKKKMQKDDHDSDSDSKHRRRRPAVAPAAAAAAAAVATGPVRKAGAGPKKGAGTGARLGSEFQSKHAPGDVKRMGRPDPFAYVPLDPKTMNKRCAGV